MRWQKHRKDWRGRHADGARLELCGVLVNNRGNDR
jgi:hypothetical protein